MQKKRLLVFTAVLFERSDFNVGRDVKKRVIELDEVVVKGSSFPGIEVDFFQGD